MPAASALYALYRGGSVSMGELTSARESLGIEPDKANPVDV